MKYMWFIWYIWYIWFVVANAEMQCTGAPFKAVQEKCLAANGGDRAILEDFLFVRKSDHDDGKCFRACLMQECKYMDADGNLEPDTYKEYLNLLTRGHPNREKLFIEAYDKCLKSTQIDADKCNTAYNFMGCLADECHECAWDLHNI